MTNRATRIGWAIIGLILATLRVDHGWAVGPHKRLDQNLETLILVLEMTPEQIKQANEIIKAGGTTKREYLGQLREKFERINEMVRVEAPSELDIKALCQEIGNLQAQMVFREAQTQIAFRKILDARQIEKLNRLEQINSGPSGPGRHKRPGGWGPPKGKDD